MASPDRQQMERWIVAAIVILALACAIPIRSSGAQGAPHQASAHTASQAGDGITRRRHPHHAYDRNAERPSYYGRPTYYAPAPFFPFPPFLVYGW